jgi:hypothetical protein
VDVFLENAQKIFDVARSDESAQPNDFALLIRPDGGLHFVMESPSSLLEEKLDDAAVLGEARIAYRVTRSFGGEVRVAGRNGNQECLLLQHASKQAGPQASQHPLPPARFTAELLRDQPLYWISSPLTLSAPSS